MSESITPILYAGKFCVKQSIGDNDGLDNDCDFAFDEELLNGVDDDGDGLVDEDTASNQYYPDTRVLRLALNGMVALHSIKPYTLYAVLKQEDGRFTLSWLVAPIVVGVILLLILIAVCHWKCSNWKPAIEEKPLTNDLESSDYLKQPSTVSAYRLSGTWKGFTISAS